MKTLLLNPPTLDNKKFIREGRCTQEQGVWATLWPPVSLATMGAVLEQAGHAVRIIDCAAAEIGWDALGAEIKQFRPQLIIWSTGTPSIDNDLGLASFIKKIDSGIATAVFGTHVTALDRHCMEGYPDVDYILRNEPEQAALDLAAAIEQGKNPAEINGLTYRAANGTIVSNLPRPFIEDIDTLPVPAWHLLDISRYRLPFSGEHFLIVAPLRGCPFNCSFCTCQTYYGKKLRKRSVDSVIQEIEYDMTRFSIKNFFIWAETFVVDKHYVEQLCRALIDRNIIISWTCNSRVDTVDQQLLKLMAQAGCWMISFGIESAEQKILDGVNKGTTVEQACDAVQSAREAGIKTVGHFIMGLPGETQQSLEKTIAYSKKLGLDLAQFYCAVPFPGSCLYDTALEKGWLRDKDFAHFNQNYALMELPTVSSQEVNKARVRAYRQFYFNVTNSLRLLKLVGWKDIGSVCRSALDFLGWTR